MLRQFLSWEGLFMFFLKIGFEEVFAVDFCPLDVNWDDRPSILESDQESAQDDPCVVQVYVQVNSPAVLIDINGLHEFTHFVN
jgi:hypothetical protein